MKYIPHAGTNLQPQFGTIVLHCFNLLGILLLNEKYIFILASTNPLQTNPSEWLTEKNWIFFICWQWSYPALPCWIHPIWLQLFDWH